MSVGDVITYTLGGSIAVIFMAAAVFVCVRVYIFIRDEV